MSYSFEDEVTHGVKLLQGISDTGTWHGGVATIEIDPECRVRDPVVGAPCGQVLSDAVILLHKDLDKPCHILAVCEHHREVMEQAVKRWREHA